MMRGYPSFESADSSAIDIKTVNSTLRNSLLSYTLESLNGSKFTAVDSMFFYKPVKEDIRRAGESALLTAVESKDHQYWVGKLSNRRGYVLLRVEIDPDYYDIVNPVITGRAKILYQYFSVEDIQGE